MASTLSAFFNSQDFKNVGIGKKKYRNRVRMSAQSHRIVKALKFTKVGV
jgi:hypothetical protein